MNPTPPENTSADPSTSRRILVVEDNRDSADSLAMLLNLSGHATEVAYDGLAALDAAERFRPDVILLDIGLPKLNGLETCRQIRERPWGKDVLMVALTGWGQEKDQRQSKEAGFDVHVVKPLHPQHILKLLAPTPARGLG